MIFEDIKGEHWCKTLFHRDKEQPEISNFAKKIFNKSLSMSTFKPHKEEKNQKLYFLVLLYPAGENGSILLHPAGGNS